MVKVCGRHVFSGLDPLVRQTVSVAAYCLLVLMRSLLYLFGGWGGADRSQHRESHLIDIGPCLPI